MQIFASKVEARPSRVAESEEREEFDDDSVRRLLTHQVESYDIRADVLFAKSFSSFEGQSYALRLAFFVALNFSVFSVPPW